MNDLHTQLPERKLAGHDTAARVTLHGLSIMLTPDAKDVMTRLFVLLTFLFIPAALTAQSGTIQYDRAVRAESRASTRTGQASPRRTPPPTVTPVRLVFSGGAVSTSVVDEEEQARGGMAPPPPPPGMMRMRFGGGAASRADNEKILATYVAPDGTVTEQREFMGREFLITHKRPTIAWKLTGEQSSFLTYAVQRATAQLDSMEIEAWFTPSIPVPAGPADYAGLPGMILVLSVDSGRVVYSATSVKLDDAEAAKLSAPTEGTRVSRDEYERIVADKLKELELERGGRGRR
jgi:hypothetical protein